MINLKSVRSGTLACFARFTGSPFSERLSRSAFPCIHNNVQEIALELTKEEIPLTFVAQFLQQNPHSSANFIQHLPGRMIVHVTIYKFHKELHSMSGLPDMHEHISSCSALLFCYIPTRCGSHWCKCLIVNWVTNFVQWSNLYWRYSFLFIRLHKKQTSQSLTYSANWSL